MAHLHKRNTQQCRRCRCDNEKAFDPSTLVSLQRCLGVVRLFAGHSGYDVDTALALMTTVHKAGVRVMPAELKLKVAKWLNEVHCLVPSDLLAECQQDVACCRAEARRCFVPGASVPAWSGVPLA